MQDAKQTQAPEALPGVQESTELVSSIGHTVRGRNGGFVTVRDYTRGRAIKVFCTECLGWGDDPKGCTSKECPLFPYRGKSFAAYGQVVEHD